MAFPSSPVNGTLYNTPDGRQYKYNSTTSTWDYQGIQDTGIKNNFVATTSPSATDDNTQGYAVGSKWIDVSNNVPYICVDATASAAIWVPTTSAGVTIASIHPSSPALGVVYFNSVDKIEYLWDGSLWRPIGPPLNNWTATSNPTASDNAAAGYSIGSRWLNTSTNSLFTCVNASTGTWIGSGSSSSVSTSSPSSPASGDLWYNTTNDLTYIWNGTAWIDIVNAGVGNVKNNFSASTPPTVTDDVNSGYKTGSQWTDTVGLQNYTCISNTAGAAVWKQTTV